jgi:hypothetical protein
MLSSFASLWMYVWMDRQLRFRTPKTQQPSHSNRRSTRCFQSIVHTENMPDQPIYTIAVRALCEFNAKRGDLDRFVEARMAVSVTHETESSATGTSAINPSQSTCHRDSRCRVPPPRSGRLLSTPIASAKFSSRDLIPKNRSVAFSHCCGRREVDDAGKRNAKCKRNSRRH